MKGEHMKRLVIDSNILLLDSQNLLTLGKDSIVVLAETVIKEVDNKKSGYGELAYQARQMGRILAACAMVSTETIDDAVITTMTHPAGVTIEIVSLLKYKDIDLTDSGANDQKIIQVAQTMEKIHGDVTFMTNDVLARIRGLTVGLKVTDLKLIDDAEFEFVKEFMIDDYETFRTIHDADVFKVDKDYKPENYSYKFTHSETKQVKLATVHNGFIKVLGRDSEKVIRQQDCPPINSEQILASKAILDPTIDMVIMEGPAGSGKNVVALSNAIQLFKANRDKYKSIVYIRTPHNDEEAGEDIGYLAGNDEKLAMYLGPMEDTLEFLVRQKIKQKPGEKKIDYDIKIEAKVIELKEKYGMQAIITTGLRGKTFHNTIFILDEWENASQPTSQKTLTRVGKDCKVLITASQSQIDNKYTNKYNNGLAVLMGEARDQSIATDVSMFAIELKKVVRSKMAEFAEKLYMEKK
jgi:PhoH-like ATPase